jgi:hypothetical protein
MRSLNRSLMTPRFRCRLKIPLNRISLPFESRRASAALLGLRPFAVSHALGIPSRSESYTCYLLKWQPSAERSWIINQAVPV